MRGIRCVLRLGAAAIGCGLLGQTALADSTERVSVGSAGTEATGNSFVPSISANGRFVAFSSDATDLVTGDSNSLRDVFVHDRQSGTTERVSVDSAGTEATGGGSSAPSISADGRFVAFQSNATNLADGDSNTASDIFVRDRQTGTTELVSVNDAGTVGDGGSATPSISADGRFVAFQSDAENLVASDINGRADVFVHDRQTGATERASIDSAGKETTGADSSGPSISADGRFVAFHSPATNLVANDTNIAFDVFVHDRQTGRTERVSVDSAGAQATAGGDSIEPSISADGRFVAFQSFATNLVANDTNGILDIFVHDRRTGRTERVSVDSAGAQATSFSSVPSISSDGRFVAFNSLAANLVVNDTNGNLDIFVHDRQSGITERVSVDSAGAQTTGSSSGGPSISADGRFVAFDSFAANLVAGDTNGVNDVFVRNGGLLPDGNNDLLVDFGGAGTWQRLDDGTWRKIHNASPLRVSAGDLNGSFKDETILSFGGAGLWALYESKTWRHLNSVSPTHDVVGDLDGNGMDDLVADYGNGGLWVSRNSGAWVKLHNGASQGLAVGDLDGNGKDELIVDFGGAGLWVRYNDSFWAKRHSASPKHMATGDLDGNGRDELIADFGGSGIWARFNNRTWVKLHGGTSQGLATGDLTGNDREELVVDFGGAGLWVRYSNGAWLKRHSISPKHMLVSDLTGEGKSEIVVDFGAAGLWARFNNKTWAKLHSATTQGIAAGGFD